jgi:predicted Zn-dependent peptidase
LLAAERDFHAVKSMGVTDVEVRVYEFTEKNAETFSIIEKLKADGLDREDFKRAKRVMYAEFVKLFDSTENIANMIFTYACDGTDVFSNHEILSALTFEEVEEHFNKALLKEYMTLSVVYPLGE